MSKLVAWVDLPISIQAYYQDKGIKFGKILRWRPAGKKHYRFKVFNHAGTAYKLWRRLGKEWKYESCVV